MTKLTNISIASTLLLGVFPVLHLYLQNSDKILFCDTYYSLAVAAALSVGVLVFFRLLLGSLDKALLMTSGVLFLSGLQGHAMDFLSKKFDIGQYLVQNGHWGWLALYGVVLGIGFRKIQRAPVTALDTGLRAINAIVFLLFGSSLAMAVVAPKQFLVQKHVQTATRYALHPPAEPPDVYYIILDGYERPDRLKQYFGFDNEEFIRFLRKQGFYVADQSRSNYSFTFLSLSSSLSMNYINDLDHAPTQVLECMRRISDNPVVASLRGAGYKIIHFSSNWAVTDSNPYADINVNRNNWNEFTDTLIQTSALRLFLFNRLAHPYALKDHINYNLDHLSSIPSIPGPKFTFAHIVSPHPPYVFDRNGNMPTTPHNGWLPRSCYIDQVVYLNHRFETIIQQLIQNSKTPPIIIIQGDHGSACAGTPKDPTLQQIQERTSILNAYYFPGGKTNALYPTITPVNSFRVLFNTYFDAQLPLLPDREYYSGPLFELPYTFQDVSQQL